MSSPEASAILLSVGLQESGFGARVQHGNGPARSFWQFEKEGVRGVLTHPSTSVYAHAVMELLQYQAVAAVAYEALANNDILACVFARLLLWTDPRAMPTASEASKGWNIYLAQWRPGKPKPETWKAHYARAWAVVQA